MITHPVEADFGQPPIGVISYVPIAKVAYKKYDMAASKN